MQFTVSSKTVKSNVTSVKFFNGYILTGVAGELYVFSRRDSNFKWDLQSQKTIFAAQNIHGIITNSKNLNFLVYGGKSAAILKFFENESNCSVEIETSWDVDDWILDVSWLSDTTEIAILTAHNRVYKFDSRTKLSSNVNCIERCILYSAKIINNEWENLILLAGTVFQEIVIWSVFLTDNVSQKKVLHRLKGHKGVIFNLAYDTKSKRICSTSDDRTIRVWSVNFTEDSVQSSNCPEQWQNANIDLQYTLFGHTARVWKSHFLSEDRIASIGEDSLICVWDKFGECERQWSGHQGGVVWSIDYSEDLGLIATGGSDSGLCLWPLSDVKPPSRMNLSQFYDKHSEIEYSTPKRLVITNFGDIILTTEGGQLLLYSEGKWELFLNDVRFRSYSVQDISESRVYLAIGNIKGNIVIFKVKKNHLEKIIDEDCVNGKIFSMNWASEDQIVTCGNGGFLSLWVLKEGMILEKLGNYILPASKERWITSAMLFGEFLLCGDRVGSIHLFGPHRHSVPSLPSKTLYKIHGPRGVSCIRCICDMILSTGRDGTVKHLSVEDDQIRLLSTDKLQMDWAAVVSHSHNFGTVVIGFHDVNFVIWSTSERRNLLKIDCGGGHRSWDFTVDDSSGYLTLAFIKNKEVHYFYNPLSKIYINSPLIGHHIKTINTSCKLPLYIEDKIVILTGSEDNTLRTFHYENGVCRPGIILRNHISSIRTVDALRVDKSTYVFSAGGRGQMKVWSMQIKENGEILAVELASHMVHSEYKIRRPWQQALPSPDPETRYMDLSVCKISPLKLLVMAGCSDCLFRLLQFDLKTHDLSVVGIFEFHNHCILKVIHFISYENIVAITMATDGNIAFWNIHELFSQTSTNVMKPWSTKIHDMGINSCDIIMMTGERLLLVTGCDDSSLGLNVFQISPKEDPKYLTSWYDREHHTCQITGVTVNYTYITSVGLDQRVSLWKWNYMENTLNVTLMTQFISYIPDIHGLTLLSVKSQPHLICVYGLGFQILNVHIYVEDFTEEEKKLLRRINECYPNEFY